MANENLGGGLEVLAAGVHGHGLPLALLYAERTVHLRPADKRRVLEVGPVVGATSLERTGSMRRKRALTTAVEPAAQVKTFNSLVTSGTRGTETRVKPTRLPDKLQLLHVSHSCGVVGRCAHRYSHYSAPTCFMMAWDTLGWVFFSKDLPTDFLGLLPFLDDCIDSCVTHRGEVTTAGHYAPKAIKRIMREEEDGRGGGSVKRMAKAGLSGHSNGMCEKSGAVECRERHA